MADLAALKTRIIAEMIRDDLADTYATQLLTHIQRACEFYSDTRFWFNAIITTATATAGSDVLDIPSTVRRVQRVTIPAESTELSQVVLGEIDRLGDTSAGRPCAYAYLNDSLRFDRTADAAYVLQITGLAQIDAPAVDADSNAWTNEAQDLICYRAQETLYRHQFRAPQRSAEARLMVMEEFARLRRETAKRLAAPRRSDRPRQSFNIYNG